MQFYVNGFYDLCVTLSASFGQGISAVLSLFGVCRRKAARDDRVRNGEGCRGDPVC